MPEKFEKDIGQETTDDLVRRYRRAFFLMYDEKDRPEVAYLQEITHNAAEEPVVHLSLMDKSAVSKRLKDVRLVEVYPEKGLYNFIRESPAAPKYGYDPVIRFSRHGSRQWMHGIRRETCRLEIVFGNDILANACPGLQPWQIINFDFNLVNNMFNPKYPASWKDALKFLEDRPQVALSRDFMLMYDFNGPDLILLKHYHIIGQADKNSIKIHESLLGQEVLDLIKRNKYEVKFEVV